MSNGVNNSTSVQLNSRADDITVGSGYCVLALIDILLIIPSMIVFRDRELREMDSYMFMFHICFWDLVQAAMHLVGGVYTLLPIDMSQVPRWLDGFSGGLISTGWLAYLFLSTLLAINRFMHVAFPHHVKMIFSNRVTKLSILMSYLYALIWMIIYMTPFVKFIYQKETYLYYYDESDGSKIAHKIDEYIGRVMIVLMGICYLGVVVMLRIMVLS
uniref:7TM GPCR serpentine receptor class x (Srx) domain-containing protein n=1 Tax=Plectus sambesii TaxID=2011161 RepID=A0A914WZE9_9BILA